MQSKKNRPRYYRLNEDRSVTPLPDGEDAVLEWGKRFENEDRQVAFDQVGNKRVSTVFLGLDHAFLHGPPLIFETMVFGEDSDVEYDVWRYSTWDEAVEGHKQACASVTTGLSREELEAGKAAIEGLLRKSD